jgi:uncharacterized membrane protein
MTDHLIGLVGIAIDLFGVAVILAGIIWATGGFIGRRAVAGHYELYKIRLGRSLLLGLELLVAADIVKTIAIEPTFMSLGVLAGLVLVRTFLSWTLTLEIEGRWPWSLKGHPTPESQGASQR